jgi:hypothetical protein
MIEIFTKSGDGQEDLKQAFAKGTKRGTRSRKLEKKEEGEKDLSSLAGLVYPGWARPGSKLAAPNKQPKKLR